MVFAQWGALTVPLLAGLASALAAWRRRGRARLAWALFALAALAWTTVGAVRMYFGQASLPFSAFDLQFALAVGPAAVGLALLPGPPPLYPTGCAPSSMVPWSRRRSSLSAGEPASAWRSETLAAT